MARIKTPIDEYRRYVDSGSWKCDKSPTGAHYWVERSGKWYCKWCGDVRKFPMTFIDAMKGEYTYKSAYEGHKELLKLNEEVEHGY